MGGTESCPPRSPHLALVVSSALSAQAASRQALCGAAPSLAVLIAARCFQGLGAAAIFSVNVAMITRSFPAAERGRALSIKRTA
jgi:MFS family permease